MWSCRLRPVPANSKEADFFEPGVDAGGPLMCFRLLTLKGKQIDLPGPDKIFFIMCSPKAKSSWE